MKRSPPERWPTEAAMFASWVEFVEDHGFRWCPEVCGHDGILVVDQPWLDALEVGDAIAVEGKLRAGVEVLAQALPPVHRRWPTAVGCDFYAVLVPESSAEFCELAQACGVLVWEWPRRADEPREHLTPVFGDAVRVHAVRPVSIPARVRMPAGMPGPRLVTRWKVAAVKLCLLAAERPLTAADFVGPEASVCKVRTFLDRGWLVRQGRGRTATFMLADVPGRPDRAYPEIVDALREPGR